MFDDETGEVFMAGIPRRGDLQRLRRISLPKTATRIATTEDSPSDE